MTNCPKCNYDMWGIYDRVCEGKKSKYCKITNYHSVFSMDAFNTFEWYVECKCPKCKNEFGFSDSNY